MNFIDNWTLDMFPNGRQKWRFTPAPPFSRFSENDWNASQGQNYLSQMSEAFIWQGKNNPNSADAIYHNQQAGINKRITYEPTGNAVLDSAVNAISFYQTLQAESGHWPGDYGGPLFLTPGLIIASYVTGTPLAAPHREMIKRYFLNHQNEDGGWGMHIESPSTMFGTVLQYVSLRLLGSNAEDAPLKKAKAWMLKHGGATGIPSWGKFYLSVLGVYDWRGVNSLFPEMWLLPKWLSVQPFNYWCHARMVYLPMAYCFGEKVTGPITPLVTELRNELYLQPYGQIDWSKARNECAATDLYHRPSALLNTLNTCLNFYEGFAIKSWRKKASVFILDCLQAEDEHTNYIDIGPVNKAINSICMWHAFGKNSEPFKKHVERWEDYLWVAEDGMKMNGYNGSQLWDTVFATQAILESGLEKQFAPTLKKAYNFIDVSQVKEEVREPEKYARHRSVGGWPFSTVEHGWPITDCSAEGLKTTLLLHEAKIPGLEKKITNLRLFQAADVVLSLQNKNGGWASYELTRGPKWLELLNPSEVFGNIMIDYSYTECTSACVQSLLQFREQFDYKKELVESAIRKGIRFILSEQRADGSWYGSWAVCFTYGSWFAIEALQHALESGLVDHMKSDVEKALAKANAFLLSKQNADGGWGERFESCIKKEYVGSAQSQVVNTSWALLSLMHTGIESREQIEKGISFLMSRQESNGDFPQENISGVFNHNCAITYTSYRNVFPIWALGRYFKKYCRELNRTKTGLIPNLANA